MEVIENKFIEIGENKIVATDFIRSAEKISQINPPQPGIKKSYFIKIIYKDGTNDLIDFGDNQDERDKKYAHFRALAHLHFFSPPLGGKNVPR